MPIAVSEGIGVGSDKMTHNFFHVLGPDLVVPNQYQTSHKTPERCDDGGVANNLSQSASIVPGTNTWYSQECHVGSQQHSTLSKFDASVAPCSAASGQCSRIGWILPSQTARLR